jgi:hypothetical protein
VGLKPTFLIIFDGMNMLSKQALPAGFLDYKGGRVFSK